MFIVQVVHLLPLSPPLSPCDNLLRDYRHCSHGHGRVQCSWFCDVRHFYSLYNNHICTGPAFCHLLRLCVVLRTGFCGLSINGWPFLLFCGLPNIISFPLTGSSITNTLLEKKPCLHTILKPFPISVRLEVHVGLQCIPVTQILNPTDTEGSFIVERVVEVATAAVQHLSSVAESSVDQGQGRIRYHNSQITSSVALN